VVRLTPKAKPYKQLRRSPELLLLMATLAAMEGPLRWRVGNELKRLSATVQSGQDREMVDDLLLLNMTLSWHREPDGD
jgi:hypothetical protein